MAKGNDLERVKALVDFGMFRAALPAAVSPSDRSRGDRSFDHVFDIQGVDPASEHSLSDERAANI